MATLYHVFILPRAGVTREMVENVLNAAPDWVRYDEKCYVIQTTETAKKWTDKLLPLVEPDGHLFICKLNATHYYGWMTKVFWDWYQAKAPLASD